MTVAELKKKLENAKDTDRLFLVNDASEWYGASEIATVHLAEGIVVVRFVDYDEPLTKEEILSIEEVMFDKPKPKTF